MNFRIGKNVVIVQTYEQPRPDTLAPKIKRPFYRINSTGCECTTTTAKGQDTQVSAAAVLIKDKSIPNVFQYRTNCLNATPMLEYRATSSQQT